VTDLHEFGAVQTAIQSQLATYRAENCMISAIVCDGEKAFGKLKDWCGNMGVRMQPTGPNQHVSVADRSIRTLKNIGRSIANNLPYVLPLFLIKWLLLLAVNRFNILPYRGRGNGNIASPIELFCGRKVDFKRDVRFSFGEYAKVLMTDTSMIKNSLTPRTEGAIALLPIGNLQESTKFYILRSKAIATKDQWTVIPKPQAVIDHLNSFTPIELVKTSKVDMRFYVGYRENELCK
jgi:hypothetical protein